MTSRLDLQRSLDNYFMIVLESPPYYKVPTWIRWGSPHAALLGKKKWLTNYKTWIDHWRRACNNTVKSKYQHSHFSRCMVMQLQALHHHPSTSCVTPNSVIVIYLNVLRHTKTWVLISRWVAGRMMDSSKPKVVLRCAKKKWINFITEMSHQWLKGKLYT